MASAVLVNRNEASWTQPRGGAKFMGKVPFSNPNPNPNSKFSKKRQFQAAAPAPPPLNFDIHPAASSDDASSINRRPAAADFNSGGYVTFNIGSYSKKELLELKNQLVAELEQIRQLKNRIDSSSESFQQIRSTPNSNKKQNKKVTGNKRPFPAAATTNNYGFVAKDVKRSNLYNNSNKFTHHPENGQLMKKCGQLLTKLMKHKFAMYVFNDPVDVKGLHLHDYYDIIKKPMDLGTVKKKLGNNLYDSPIDFAADVRLTFNNAMKYNPKGHDVYNFAEQLLSRFEELFRPIREKLGDFVDDDQFQDQDQVVHQNHEIEIEIEHENERVHEVEASSWDHHSLNRSSGGGVVDRVKKDQENVLQSMGKSDNHPVGKSIASTVLSNPQSTSQLPVRTPSPMRAPPVKPVKLPKPKAKDPNKREMSFEEKHKLGVGLQNLPQEKMELVVQIIRKRNGHLRQEGDEIELDIEAVDTETLWELDRFVTNYKKMASKLRRQELMAPTSGTAVSEGNKDVSGNERMEITTEAKKPKKGDAGDEDVDIGDEIPMSSFPPVEIEKDNGHASSSSSSSSSSSDESSSSSDSDSGSSSGSDSEDAHS